MTAGAPAFALLLSACGAGDVSVQDESGFQAALNLLTAEISGDLSRTIAPGLSIAVVQGDNTLWSRGFGFADLASRTPAGADTIYAIGSITKLFTATMLMQLRDARLDELISKMRAAPTLPARHG